MTSTTTAMSRPLHRWARRLMAMLLIAVLTISPATWTAAQVNLPHLGDGASDELSPMMERRLGERIMGELRSGREIFEDAELTEYVNMIGSELAGTSASLGARGAVGVNDYTFFVIHDSTINAFALPGGFIGVHTGLLTAAQTESELASVLAHEIGHVTQRHIARMFGEQKGVGWAMLGTLALAILAARSNSSSGGDAAQAALMVGQASMIQKQLNFSRDAEREADRVGFQTLTASGFESRGMVDFFSRLQSSSRIYESSAPGYLRTHPLTVERITDIQNRVRGERYRQRVDRFDFHLARARVKALTDVSVQALRDTRASFESLVASASPGHNLVAAASYYGLAIVQLQQRDFAAAAKSLAQARERGDAHPWLDKLKAEWQIAQGNGAAAVTTMKAAQAQWPSSSVLRVFYAEALQAAGDHAAASVYLRDQISLYRGDPHLYELLAKSYQALNNPAREHQALAEMYRLRGALPAAVQQLEIAQRAAKTSNSNEALNLLSELNARLRELRDAAAFEAKERKESGF